MDKISFVMPAYNASSTIAEAIDSIFNGNFEPGDEVIIVDDCSTDDTPVLAESLSQKYAPHITVIFNSENKGCPASRNIGIRVAKNDLIFNLDSDNVLGQNQITHLRKAIVDGVDVAAFNEYKYFTHSIREISHRWVCKTGIFTLADLFSGIINQGPGGNFLYRKSIWERIGGYWEYGKGLHEAWGFSLKLLINGAKFVIVPDTYYFHRYSHQSLFVRESKKPNEEREIVEKFIAPALPLLSKESVDYISNNNDWYAKLNNHPLYLADGSKGIDGKLVYTSFIKQILYRIRLPILKIRNK